MSLSDVSTCRRALLPCGIPLLTENIPGVRSVALGIWVAAGSREETAAECGMAHFVEHLLFKGTANRTAADIAREVDSLGGHLDAFTSREYTCFFVSLLDDRLDRGGSLLADIFLRSQFQQKDIDLERGVILEEISMVLDNPEENLHDLTMAQVWGGNPLARPIQGTAETVGGFNRPEVTDFWNRHYAPGVAFLAAAGHLNHDDFYTRAAGWFEGAPPVRERLPRRAPVFTPGVVREEKPLNQVYIDMNMPGIPQDHELRYPSHVLNAILGGTISSRLFQKIREERGLVYSIYSGLSSHQDAGLLHISAGTGPALARQVIDLVSEELRLLRREAPTADEIRRAKDHLMGSTVLSMESTPNRMSKLGKQELYFGRKITLEETLASIEAVNTESVERAAALFFSGGQLSWGFLGPTENLPADSDLPTL